jgi:hypothetical protein
MVSRLCVLQKHSFRHKISKLQGNHYRNVSTDPLETTDGGFLGIRVARFGNHYS